MKKCSKCNETRETKFFSKDTRNSDGLQSQCQICRKTAKQKVALSRRGIVTIPSKCCNQCKNTKDASEFYKDSGLQDGLSNMCKTCKDVRTEKWRDKNREQYNSNMRDMRANQKERFKDIDLKRTHGISLEDYNRMLKNQNGRCNICNKLPQGIRPLVVDHEHATGKIRGLLCYGCNRALHVLENPPLLEASTEYLKKYK